MNSNISAHSKVILIVACILVVFLNACVNKSFFKAKSTVVRTPISKEAVLANPFGYKPTIKNLSINLLPYYNLQIYSIRNIHNPQVSDTIYRFYRKKSELFIYKTITGRELLFAANIFDSKVVLKNGVRVGVTKEEFYNSFTNLKPITSDTVIIGSKKAATTQRFLFKHNKLDAIKIDNYID